MSTIALAGNPNSGKSTLFNALTGATQFVGNWPGVTVEKKEGKTKINGKEVKVMDLPGIYSLSPYSKEEIISRDYILNDNPDVVVDIVDASNIERNLYLTTQLIELGVPVVVALNMIDVVEKKGEKLSAENLSKQLGCPVVEIAAISNKGIDKLKDTVEKVINGEIKFEQHKFEYSNEVENAFKEIKASYLENSNQEITDFFALKILADDKSMLEGMNINEKVLAKAQELKQAIEDKFDDDFESIIAEQRYAWINSIIDKVILTRRKEVLSLSDKIDKVLTNKWLGLPIFFLIIYAIYWVCLNPHGLGKYLVGVTFGWLIDIMGWTTTTLTGWGVWPWLISLISDGIIFGVGIVVAFVPYLMVLFIFLAILEECGYMARVAFIMDRVFRKFGLSGKSFIPMLLGTGCTVQGIASTRTIENEQDRRMTIFLTPFMPCATKMPTIILVASLLAGNNAFIAPCVYIIAIVFVILGGIFLKKTTFKSEPAPFVMELPEYKIPTLKNIWHFVWDKTVSFFRKAATIIFVSTVVIWFLKYFTFGFQPSMPNLEDSMLAGIGKFFSYIFMPLGFGTWQICAAMLTGFVAKDNFLGTLGQIYGTNLLEVGLGGILTPAAAVSFLLFFILSSPCFASMGAMRKELGSAKLTFKAIGFQMATAYIISLVAFQILRWII